MARAVIRRISRLPVARSVFDTLYHSTPYSEAEEHAEADRLLQMQFDEDWTRCDEHHMHESHFHHGHNANFDPEP